MAMNDADDLLKAKKISDEHHTKLIIEKKFKEEANALKEEFAPLENQAGVTE